MQFQKYFSVLILWVSALACSYHPRVGFSTQGPSTGIINGQAVSDQDPLSQSVVGIYLRPANHLDSLLKVCTGTLIERDIVLTAAHCLDDEISVGAENFYIVFGTKVLKGSNDLEKSPYRRGLQKIIHPQWENPGMINSKAAFFDVALLKIEGQAPSPYKPTSFATQDLILEKGEHLIGYGYGLLNSSTQQEPEQLMKGGVKVHDWEFSQTHFQAIGDPSSICHGDSGGPAFWQDSKGHSVIVGIASFAPASCDQESYYVRVSQFSLWITNSIQQLKEEQP